MHALKDVNIGVVGHIEWVSFVSVGKMPAQGVIDHGNKYIEEPAGGGAVAAVQMTKLNRKQVHFFTALGNDSIGKTCFKRLTSLGIKMHVAWRERPTRRAFSFVDTNGERSITVIGERLEPISIDPLPWQLIKNLDGIFITAADAKAIKFCRKAKIVCATPRVKASHLNESSIELDALISSQFDQYEQKEVRKLTFKPKTIISTEGALGGTVKPGSRYQPVHLNEKPIAVGIVLLQP